MLKALALFPLLLAAAAQDYKVTGKIQIGGPGQGWDYITAEPASHRLYVSNGNRVVIVDTLSNKVSGEISGGAGIHGIALAPGLGKGFISCGADNKVIVFDLKTLKQTSTVATGQNPDAIILEPTTNRLFTFNGRSKDASVFDAATLKPAATIPLGGKPEFAQVDGKGKIYVNNEDTAEIMEIDAKALKVLRKWPLAPCEEPSGLAIDLTHNRLFSVCSNKLMTVSDIAAGKLLTTLPIGDGADGVAYDPATSTAFSSNGEGTMTIVRETNGKYAVVQTLKTARGARTIVVDPSSHIVYTPTAAFGPVPPPTAQTPHPRPRALPDTFHLLMVARP